jgi:hypothetical protein
VYAVYEKASWLHCHVEVLFIRIIQVCSSYKCFLQAAVPYHLWISNMLIFLFASSFDHFIVLFNVSTVFNVCYSFQMLVNYTLREMQICWWQGYDGIWNQFFSFLLLWYLLFSITLTLTFPISPWSWVFAICGFQQHVHCSWISVFSLNWNLTMVNHFSDVFTWLARGQFLTKDHVKFLVPIVILDPLALYCKND